MISNHEPLEKRLRFAINILCYDLIKTRRLHYSDEGAQNFLRSLRKTAEESQLVLVAGSYPVICAHCGKQVGTNDAYATIATPRFPIDCCFVRSRDAVLSKLIPFTAFNHMPVIPLISYFMDIPMHIVQHYATLEAITYFAQKEKAIHELSRYSNAAVLDQDLILSLPSLNSGAAGSLHNTTPQGMTYRQQVGAINILSYSTSCILHACPRRFLLRNLQLITAVMRRIM